MNFLDHVFIGKNIIHKNLLCIKKCRNGLTLIELLVAVVVLAVGCLVAMSLQTSAMQQGSQAANLSVASFLIESKSEWLRSLSLDAVRFVPSTPEKLLSDGTTCTTEKGCDYTLTTLVFPNYPTSRSCLVQINVEWKSAFKDYKVTYNTTLSDIGF